MENVCGKQGGRSAGFAPVNSLAVSSEFNPADCASRGVSPAELKSSELWWHGPEWLQHSIFPESNQVFDNSIAASEEKATTVTSGQTSIDVSYISKFSSLNKLKRVTAYCLRFIHNCRNNDSRLRGALSCAELQKSFLHWIRQTQASEMSNELKSLTSKDHEVSVNSKLKSLYPYIDAVGIMRVGGRLHRANMPESQKHQIILPSHHQLTSLIIQHHHITHLHAGPQLLQAVLQQQFWIIRARDSIRHITRRCVICRRHRAATAEQLMGSLPTARVNHSRPFQHCGIDYAGPFNLREFNSRGKKTFKGYICVFVCLATKAIHLEAASDLTTEAFLAAFKRFISRRGISTDLYSDCGTNFVGADRELKPPHHGGLWEAGVKSVKHHLRRVIGTATLNFEEFQTLLCQIEAVLNSRPLCAISNHPDDLTTLTPGHFLIGNPLTAVQESDFTTTKVNRLSRWQFTQQLLQHFWKRWSAEYLSTLQQRFKWTAKRENLQVNDLVLIKDDLQPPMKWKLGRIIQTHPGSDNQVRVVTVKTASSEFKRPITKLCPLIHADADKSD